MRAIILLPFLIWSTFAQDCSSFSRAVVTDQKNMASDVALQYLQVDQQKVTHLEVRDYSSWKQNQKGCLADVIHYAQIVLELKKENTRCLMIMDLHTKDDFTSGAQFEREYKVRNITQECGQESPQQAAQAMSCEQAPKCERGAGAQIVKDYNDNCRCKYFEELTQLDDTGDLYDDFFNVLNLFKKPVDIISPF